MPIRLILSDIDGTILPFGNETVSGRTRAAFHAALDAGIAIGPSSGRGHQWLAPLFAGDEACCATAIASNGLEVFYDDKPILTKVLPREALIRTAELTAALPHAGLLCFDGLTPYFVSGSREDLAQAYARYAKLCVPVDGVPTKPLVKANVFVAGDLDATRELVALLNEEVDGLDFDVPQRGFVNVMPAGWNKGEAVEYLASYLGIGLDEVVVFGDAANDVTMFDKVVNSVAVANALSEASEAARWHIGDVADDAVAAAIEAIVARQT